MYDIKVPHNADNIISIFEKEGYRAYVVGGCVRDSLMGRAPHDWDICTPCTPEDAKNILRRYGIKTVDTGIKHGTVTAVIDRTEQYEITTFRVDGEYTDNRHPDNVRFVNDISEDLARRDFTINAMAFYCGELVDPFGGEADIRGKTIKCVGDPNDRFNEDALRILRALRFAATLDFTIDTDTADAVHKNRDMLKHIAPERIQSELCKLLLGKNVTAILLEFNDVISTIIPEISACIGFEQKNRYHQYTVYDHIAHAVGNYTGDDLAVKVALLLHDIGKPQCYTEEDGIGHFYGHAAAGRDIACSVLDRLRFDNLTKSQVLDLVYYHDMDTISTQKSIRRWLNRIGEERFSQLIKVRIADIEAQAPNDRKKRVDQCYNAYRMMLDVLKARQCFSLKDLAVNGKDILECGVQEGRMVGDILQYILNQVIDGKLPNQRDELLRAIYRYVEQ